MNTIPMKRKMCVNMHFSGEDGNVGFLEGKTYFDRQDEFRESHFTSFPACPQ